MRRRALLVAALWCLGAPAAPRAAGEIFDQAEWLWGSLRMGTTGDGRTLSLGVRASRPWGLDGLALTDLRIGAALFGLRLETEWGQLRGPLLVDTRWAARIQLPLPWGLRGGAGFESTLFAPAGFGRLRQVTGCLEAGWGRGPVAVTLARWHRPVRGEDLVPALDLLLFDLRFSGRVGMRIALLESGGRGRGLVVEQGFDLSSRFGLSFQYRSLPDDWNLRVHAGIAGLVVELYYGEHPVLGPSLSWGVEIFR